MKSEPPPPTIGETALLHAFPAGSDHGLASAIGLLIEENEKLRRLAALLTSQLEVMRAAVAGQDQPELIRRVSGKR